MTENLKWNYMVDLLANFKGPNITKAVAEALASSVGKVQPKGRRYNLLVKPIAQ